MSSHSSLSDKISSGRYYMNKIFGSGVERARALDHDSGASHALGTVRRVTIEPHADGSHRVVVERSAAVAQKAGPAASRDRVGESTTSEHAFSGAGDALRFLNNVLSDRPPAAPASGGEADRFLNQVLDESGASNE